MSKKLKFLVPFLILVFVLGFSFVNANNDTPAVGDTVATTDFPPTETTPPVNQDDTPTATDEGANTNLPGTKPTTVRDRIQSAQDAFRTTVQDRTDRIKSDVNTLRTNLRDDGTTGQDVNQEHREGTFEDRRAELEAKKTERQAELDARKAERIDKMKARARAHVERVQHRFEAAIVRIEKFIERVRSRMVKFEENGVDVSESEALLVEAETSLSAARDALSNIFIEIDIALASDNPKDEFNKTIREAFASAKKHIKAAHASVVEAIRLLRNSVEDRHEGTSEGENDEGENDEEENESDE